MGRSQEGSVSVWIMGLFVLVSVVGVEVITAAREAAPRFVPFFREAEEWRELAERADEIFLAIEGDRTPGADSRHDDAYRLADAEAAAGRRVELADLSSESSDYRYANVNLLPLSLLAHAAALAGDDPAVATAVVTEIARRRARGGIVQSEEVEEILARCQSKSYPLLSALPQVNVNLAGERTLREAIDLGLSFFPERSGGVGRELLLTILRLRRDFEIDERELRSLLTELPGCERMLQVLGVRTWVFRVTVFGNEGRLVRIAARVPSTEGERLLVVGSYFERVGSEERPTVGEADVAG